MDIHRFKNKITFRNASAENTADTLTSLSAARTLWLSLQGMAALSVFMSLHIKQHFKNYTSNIITFQTLYVNKHQKQAQNRVLWCTGHSLIHTFDRHAI